jgi:putative flippase GtrA
VELVRTVAQSHAGPIIVVDDGSGAEFAERFGQTELISSVHLLRHAVNLGKGAALKTGINFFLVTFPNFAGLVTADADGQHAADDILRVGAQLQAHPEVLILGTRQFDNRVPLRSRVGNQISRALVHMLIGQRLSDTQTGLRGIPRSLLPHLLRIAVSGYDFELEMLITAKHLAYRMREESVRTIYVDGNRTSHFNPILDSTRIYFILLRFGTLSLLTALVDNVVFFTAYHFTGGIGRSQILARLVSVVFNYAFARRLVFLSKQEHRIVLPKYLLLVLCSGLLSYSLIRLLTSAFGMNVMPAKLLAEGLIFIANFTIQRDFVFTKRES